MSSFVGPAIVNDSVVFSYDINNSQKSWQGAPTTNLLGNPFCANNTGPINTFFSGYESSATIVSAFNSEMERISPNWIKYVKNSATNGRIWFLGVSGLNTTTDYTYSVYVYTNDSNVTGFTLGSDNGAVSNTTNVLSSWSSADRNRVKRIAAVFRSLNGNQVQGCRINNSDPIGTTFYMSAFQCEQSSIATPVINGSRSNTQSIIDLTGNTIITANNLSYSSDGSFSFNGTSSVLSTPTLPYQFLNTGFTISIGFRYTQTTTNDNLISWGNNAFNAGLSYSWEIRLRGAGNVEFSPGVYSSGTSPTRTSYSQSPAFNGRDVILDVVYTANGPAYIYENGQLKASNDYTGVGLFTNTQSLKIGQGTDTYFPGRIYFTKIYNRPLSNSEIQQNFNAIRSRFGI